MSSEPSGFRIICSTRDSVFQEPEDECLEIYSECDIGGNITGMKYQTILFDYFFDGRLSYLLLNYSDNLLTLQHSHLSIGECQTKAYLTTQTLSKLQSNDVFSKFWEINSREAKRLEIENLVLPCNK